MTKKIGTKMKAFVCMLAILCGYYTADAQNDTTRKIITSNQYEYYVGPLIHQFPMLEQLPPLESDMPLDVILAYIVADSVARNTTDQDAQSYLTNEITEEQLFYALKYIYQMVDYDPVRYTQWAGGNMEDNYLCGLGGLRTALCINAEQSLSEGRLLSLLAYSDYILQVRVLGVEVDTNTSALWARHANLISAEILDPVKGRMIPLCEMANFQGVSELGYKQPVIPGSCIQFDYRDEWERCVGGGNATQVGGWVSQDAEFIVFLRFIGVQRNTADSSAASFNTRTLSPVNNCLTSVVGMYPIVNGVVIDEQDDFGFGTGLAAEAWKSELRAKIYSLINR